MSLATVRNVLAAVIGSADDSWQIWMKPVLESGAREMTPPILEPTHIDGALLTLLVGTSGESSGWTAAGSHPLALAGFLLAIYGVLGAVRRKLSNAAREPLQASRTDR